jgi:carboxyl-terminal processing protease
MSAVPASSLRVLLSRSLSHLTTLAATGGLVLLSASGLAADASPPPVASPITRLARGPFDAPAAWAEFAELLRMDYAYLTRPGIEGEAILAYFEPKAKATTTKEAFRDVLQLVAHNFADPHFIVGPLDLQDYNVVPTSSDLCARYRAGRAEVVDVRRDSDAQQQGIAPGVEISSINGQTPQAAIEAVMGRPLATLSAPQLDAGLNIALAGLRQQPRQLTLATGGRLPTYTLRSPGEQAKQVQAAAPLSIERRGEAAIIRFNNSLGRNETITAFQSALREVQAAKVLVLDFRNTPSGGNTTVARGIMGHFVRRERPYQVHVVPSEMRRYGVPRKFVEYVLPIAPYYPGKLVVLGGHWTGSMGEGLLVGFHALGFRTAGSGLADLLGGLFNEHLDLSEAKVDLGEEQILQVNGQPREDFVPDIFREASEGRAGDDPLLEQAIRAAR